MYGRIRFLDSPEETSRPTAQEQTTTSQGWLLYTGIALGLATILSTAIKTMFYINKNYCNRSQEQLDLETYMYDFSNFLPTNNAIELDNTVKLTAEVEITNDHPVVNAVI